MILGELLGELLKTNGIAAAADKGRNLLLFVSLHLGYVECGCQNPHSYLIV